MDFLWQHKQAAGNKSLRELLVRQFRILTQSFDYNLQILQYPILREILTFNLLNGVLQGFLRHGQQRQQYTIIIIELMIG